MAEVFRRSINGSFDVSWSLGRRETKRAIDKAGSLVPHSPPSKPPLNARQGERVAPQRRGSLTSCLHIVGGVVVVVEAVVLL